MLKELRISNYALIEELGLRPDESLNTITGETGAGKSIMLGALGLILGQRADLTVLRDPTRKCVVEANFDVSKLGLEAFFEEHNLDLEPVSIVRREIVPSGKSYAFVNGKPVKLPVLCGLSEHLIDIHGQDQTQWLNKAGFQLALVDSIARNRSVLADYKKLYSDWIALKRQLEEWKDQQQARQTSLDYHQFLLNELEEAGLTDGEVALLEEEANTLEHAEEIRGTLSKSLQLIDEDSYGIVNNIKMLRSFIDQLSAWGNRYAEWLERIESQIIEWDDLSFEMNRSAADIEVDPARLEAVNSRLDLLHGLMQKHQVDDVKGLIAKRDALSTEVQGTFSLSGQIDEGVKQLDVLSKELRRAGSALSASRREAQEAFIEKMSGLLRQLGMPDAQFALKWKSREEPGPNGLEEVTFMFSANKGRAPKPLKKIASGGEMSRFMLGVKNLVAQYRQLPTILFDEIDTGVSGEMADRMGALMAGMGKQMQVICITHLPQVAAKGCRHFKVFKDTTEHDTVIGIRELRGSERVEEVASMLSGIRRSEAARQAARELLAENVA